MGPPPFQKKISKKSQFFLIRKFRIRRDSSPPLSEFFWKKNSFFLDASPKHNDILLSSSSSWHVNYKDGGKISIAGGAQVETGGFGIWTKAVVSEPAVKKKPRPLYSPCGWVTEVLMYCEKILPPHRDEKSSCRGSCNSANIWTVYSQNRFLNEYANIWSMQICSNVWFVQEKVSKALMADSVAVCIISTK